MRAPLLLSAFALVSLAAAADYTLTPGESTAKVHIALKKGERANEFRMPAWAPGDYEILNYGKAIDEVTFTLKGKSVPGVHSETDVNLWTMPKGADAVTYTVKPSSGNFSPNLQIRGSECYINGAGVYGWFKDHQDEQQNLVLKVDSRIVSFSAMPGENNRFRASNYDELLDSPTVMSEVGKIRVAEKVVAGKPHRVVFYGENAAVDVDGFLTVGAAVGTQAFNMFGELPYDRYTFFFDMGGQGGGLEHMNSTRIGLGRSAKPQFSVGIMFHEYFHCFNVKRIRSRPLGPFDYTKPAVTGALWWLEGVTDYYADVLAIRAGYVQREDGLSRAYRATKGVSQGNYLKISADEASRRAWETEGSYGFGGVNYYSRGHALGFYIDMAIRTATDDQKSLDDVMRKLYKECKNGPGFGEDQIHQIVTEIAGAKVGAMYEEAVKQPIPLNFNDFFAAFGIQVDEAGRVADPTKKLTWPAAPGTKK